MLILLQTYKGITDKTYIRLTYTHFINQCNLYEAASAVFLFPHSLNTRAVYFLTFVQKAAEDGDVMVIMMIMGLGLFLVFCVQC